MNKPNAPESVPNFQALFDQEIRQTSTSDGITRSRRLASYIVGLIEQDPPNAQQIIDTHLHIVRTKISEKLASFVSGSISEQLQGFGFTKQDMVRSKIAELLGAKNYDGRYQSERVAELIAAPRRTTADAEAALQYVGTNFGQTSFMAQAVRARVEQIFANRSKS